MSENTNYGFAKLIPGFDFLQNLTKGASQSMPQMPSLSSWIAPTLNVEELEKRITELKAVQFWLEQNGKALAATVQALEVQRMTLATLNGMNFSMSEVADALKLKAAEAAAPGASKAAPATGKRRQAEGKEPPADSGNGKAAPVDPLQWWGALTQQFQEIATNAMQDVAQKTRADTAAKTKRKPAKKSAARKSPARKAAAS